MKKSIRVFVGNGQEGSLHRGRDRFSLSGFTCERRIGGKTNRIGKILTEAIEL